MSKKIYLAIPYVNFGMNLSYMISNKVAADLLKAGHFVFSPISQCHIMAQEHDLPKDFPFWERLDKCFIDWADEVHVIDVGKKNIEESKGVQAEIKYAKETNKKVKYIKWTKEDTLLLFGQQVNSTVSELVASIEKDFVKYKGFIKKLTQ